MRATEFVTEYIVKNAARFLRLGMSPDGVYTARILTPGGEREISDRDLKRLEQTVQLKYGLQLPAGYRLGEDQASDNLSYQGNCTEDDVVEYIFGDVNNFARMIEEYGDEFELKGLVVKYNPEKDIHYFYYKTQNEEQLDELDFMGSPCTKDCSGHRAGYQWSRARGGVQAASWSPSFNNGAAIAAAGR